MRQFLPPCVLLIELIGAPSSGFAVVFAEDVPDVSTVDDPPGKIPFRRCPSLLI